MLESIEFTNFKALRKTTLPLAPFTLLLGPNGSGNSSVLQGLQGIAVLCGQQVGVYRQVTAQFEMSWSSMVSVMVADQRTAVEIKLRLRLNKKVVSATFQWNANGQSTSQFTDENGNTVRPEDIVHFLQWLGRMQVYSLDFSAIARPTLVNSGANLETNGGGLAAVLHDLKDKHPERWGEL